MKTPTLVIRLHQEHPDHDALVLALIEVARNLPQDIAYGSTGYIIGEYGGPVGSYVFSETDTPVPVQRGCVIDMHPEFVRPVHPTAQPVTDETFAAPEALIQLHVGDVLVRKDGLDGEAHIFQLEKDQVKIAFTNGTGEPGSTGWYPISAIEHYWMQRIQG